MFSAVLGLFSQDLAVDLGSHRTRIWLRGSGIICDEPTVVAVHKRRDGHRAVVAVGEEAHAMIGRTPDDVEAIRPVRGGRIVDFEVAEAFLLHVVRTIHGRNRMIRPRMAVALPHDVSDMELRAFRDSCEHAGARDVRLVPRPLAAALGADLPVHDASGYMIVDVGAGSTEIAVLSLTGIVTTVEVPGGGDGMDRAITTYIERHHALLIGQPTAEAIKRKLGRATPGAPASTAWLKGRCARRGVPRAIEATSDDVCRSLAPNVRAIAEGVRRCLQQTPPELAADIVDHGVVLCGAGSLLADLDLALRDETGLPVVHAEDPSLAVVRGAGRVLEHAGLMQAVAC